MSRIVLRFGVFSVISIFITGFANYYLNRDGYTAQEIGGYVGIIISMVFVYFGIRQYRDKVNGGTITYLKALGIGLLIIILPALAFGVFDVIYIKYLDPDFMEKYYNHYVAQMRASLPPAKFQAKLSEMEKEKAMFQNIYLQFAVMTATVLIVGTVISAISALILQKKLKTQTV